MSLYFCGHTRLIILLLAIVCLTLMMSNTLVWNMTQICIPDSENPPHHEGNLVLAGAYYGCLIGALPITYIMNNYGTRIMFTGYGLVGAIATAAMPTLYKFGFWPLITLRIIQGIPIAAMFVGTASITQHWSPLNATGLYLSWMTCNVQFAIMFTMVATSYLCETAWGWQSAYYVHAALSVFVFGAFFLFFRDSPRQHCNVGAVELAKIERGKMNAPVDRKVPYALMLRDSMIWVILLATSTGLFAIYVLIQYAPVYLEQALKADVRNVGVATAIPYALSCVVKVVVGPLSDRCTFLSERTRIILFASASQIITAVSYITLANFTQSDAAIRLCYTMIIVGSGLNVIGVLKSVQEVARCYSHVIMAWVVIIIGLINGFLLPAAKSLLVPNNEDMTQWNHLFNFTAGLVLFGSVIFVLAIEVTPRDWAVETAMPEGLTPPDALSPMTPTTSKKLKTAKKSST